MKFKSNQPKAPAERAVKDIQRATRRHCSDLPPPCPTKVMDQNLLISWNSVLPGYGLLKEFIGFTQIEMNCINRNYHKTLLVPTDYDIATVFTPKSHLSKLKHAHI